MSGIQAIGVLIIRVWAASVVITSVNGLAFTGLLDGLEKKELLVALIIYAVWLAAAVSGWIWASRLSGLLVPQVGREPVAISINVEDLVAAGSFLIGGFYLVASTPSLVTNMARVMGPLIFRDANEMPRIYALDIASLPGELVVFAAAPFLTFKPREIARLFLWLRRAGVASGEEN